MVPCGRNFDLTERLGAAAKYRGGLGCSAQRPRAVQMVLRTIGQSLLPGEKRQFLNLGACYGTKSSRLEKKLAHSSTETQRTQRNPRREVTELLLDFGARVVGMVAKINRGGEPVRRR